MNKKAKNPVNINKRQTIVNTSKIKPGVKKTWAPNKEMQIKPIQECKLKKFATIPSLPWNFVQIPKIPQARASPWRHKCTDFLKPLEPGNHLCTKIAEIAKTKKKKTETTRARINLHFVNHYHVIIEQAN